MSVQLDSHIGRSPRQTWFSSGRLRPVVPFESAAEVLEGFGASPEILGVYIASIDGTERRLEHAKKFGCYKIVVDVSDVFSGNGYWDTGDLLRIFTVLCIG